MDKSKRERDREADQRGQTLFIDPRL